MDDLPTQTPTTSPPAGALTFAPGETSKNIDVLIDGGASPEPAETFTIELALAGERDGHARRGHRDDPQRRCPATARAR